LDLARGSFFAAEIRIRRPLRIPDQKVIVGSTDNKQRGVNMKRCWSLGILTAVILARGSPVLAHEDHQYKEKTARAEGSESVGPQAQAGTYVTVRLFQYQPGRIQVKAGTTVTWVNEDEIFHTVTAGEPEKKGSGFDGPLDGKGKSFSFTFSQPGTYSYYCDRHEHMRGEIEVR
jgi:plastocyanin